MQHLLKTTTYLQFKKCTLVKNKIDHQLKDILKIGN